MMNYNKGDLFIGKSEGNSSVILLVIEDTSWGFKKETLCLYLNFPAAPEKVGTTDFFNYWALDNYYHKVE